MEFFDGDEIHGRYGNRWYRRNGLWQNPDGSYAMRDDTAEWLLMKANQIPTPKVSVKNRKISKTEPLPPESFIFQYTLRREQ